eukprot:1181678-Prorocentrum_minimum.AAC.2
MGGRRYLYGRAHDQSIDSLARVYLRADWLVSGDQGDSGGHCLRPAGSTRRPGGVEGFHTPDDDGAPAKRACGRHHQAGAPHGQRAHARDHARENDQRRARHGAAGGARDELRPRGGQDRRVGGGARPAGRPGGGTAGAAVAPLRAYLAGM